MKILVIEVTKEIGKKMSEICPQYVFHTCHKRHYYISESSAAMANMRAIENLINFEKANKLAEKKERKGII